MALTHVTLKITFTGPPTRVAVLDDVPLTQTVAAVIHQALLKLGLPPVVPGYALEYQGLPLAAHLALQQCLGAYAGVVELTLRGPAPAPPLPAPGAAPPPTEVDYEESGSQAVALEDLGDSFEDADYAAASPPPMRQRSAPKAKKAEAFDEDEADDATAARRPPKQAGPTTRNATVRYYSQMNPERVFPLLVLLTRGMVEKVKKKGVAQKSTGPIEIDEEQPVEIEPILPGCQVYPPKVTTRLGDRDLKITFRVVPHVLGAIDGASVVIRQDHTTLADIDLEMKVVQRTWVLLSGAMTLLLPAASAVMKHFGLDFDTQRGQGFSLYVTAARVVFDFAPPAVLTAVLGAATAALWWLTRPKARDVFHEVKTVSAEEKLTEVRAAMAADPEGASQVLLEALKAFPDHQPLRLLYAEWHFDLENYRAALAGYRKALRLGPAGPDDYMRAALSAARMNENAEAVEVLREAEAKLGSRGATGPMLYNRGCYHARLNALEDALACLRRAVAAGYRKKETFRTDPDLAPLRGRADFQQLVATL